MKIDKNTAEKNQTGRIAGWMGLLITMVLLTACGGTSDGNSQQTEASASQVSTDFGPVVTVMIPQIRLYWYLRTMRTGR